MTFLMTLLLSSLLLAPRAAGTCVQAQQLLSWDDQLGQFQLGKPGLDKLRELPEGEALTVIAIIGEARKGKSTTLNGIASPDGKCSPFLASAGFEATTRGVFMYVVDKTVFLDIEGIDLGKDMVVDQLSAIAGMMSSELILYVHNRPSNKDVHFLHRFVRLADVWTAGGSNVPMPRLHVAVREPLAGADTTTIVKFILQEANDGLHSVRDALRQKFASLNYHPIPHMENDQYEAKLQEMRRSLRAHKKSPTGVEFDGPALADILENRLFEHMTSNNYPFGDEFNRIEVALCQRSYQKLIEPIFTITHVTSIRHQWSQARQQFGDKCSVKSELQRADSEYEAHVGRLEAQKRTREAEQEVAEAERRHKEELRQREEAERRAEKRRQEDLRQRQEAERQAEKRRHEERERERRHQELVRQAEMRHEKELAQERTKQQFMDGVIGMAAVALPAWFLR